MNRTFLIFLLLFFSSVHLFSQRPLGTWRTFWPYTVSEQVCTSQDRIYCATPYSIYYIEKSDGSVSTLDKTNGLSDADVRHIAYNQQMNTLIITYASSNIDLLVNGNEVYNIPDIKNTLVTGSKNINDIACIGNYAWLATDLGISVLDLGQQQIQENYNISKTGGSVKVTSLASDGTSIFAATTEGLKSALLSTPNLQDFHQWTVYDTLSGLPKGACSLTGQLNNRFYAVVNDTLYVDSNSHFYKLAFDSLRSYISFTNTGGFLYACLWPNTAISGKIEQIGPDGSIHDTIVPGRPRPWQIAADGNTNWIADGWSPLEKFNGFSPVATVAPDGPPDNNVFRMAVANHTLYMAAGGTDPSYIGYNYNSDGPVTYDQAIWKSYNINGYPQIQGCKDLVDVAVDNVHHKAYWASLWGGLVEMDLTNNTITHYDTSNSPLGTYYHEPVVKITALALDQNGNLWMSNNGVNNANQQLVLKTYDGQWATFNVPYGIYVVRKMIVDANGYVWMGGRTYNSNLVVYNPGQNLLDASDDQFVNLTTASGNGGLPSSSVWTMVCDNAGNVWVGTDVGIATFYCSSGMFAGGGGVGCDATLIKVNQGGYIGYLFSTQIVQALAADGAGRIWVGTTNGVWLISSDGTKQLLQFDKDNSPLPSNTITEIQVDQQSGEVWIGTLDGLVSYMGDAITGASTKGDAFVYPNPVKSDYNGPIAIKGLVENAYVKITDAAGVLVYQGQANGGQMIWNGQSYNGKKVASGIYLVYADASDGSQHNVGKVIFIK